MSNKQQNKAWSVWIDEIIKTKTIKETPKAKQVFYETREHGMEAIMVLVSKGYKIG